MSDTNDRVTDWILDRAANSIERPSVNVRPLPTAIRGVADRAGRWFGRRAGGRRPATD